MRARSQSRVSRLRKERTCRVGVGGKGPDPWQKGRAYLEVTYHGQL